MWRTLRSSRPGEPSRNFRSRWCLGSIFGPILRRCRTTDSRTSWTSVGGSKPGCSWWSANKLVRLLLLFASKISRWNWPIFSQSRVQALRIEPRKAPLRENYTWVRLHRKLFNSKIWNFQAQAYFVLFSKSNQNWTSSQELNYYKPYFSSGL